MVYYTVKQYKSDYTVTSMLYNTHTRSILLHCTMSSAGSKIRLQPNFRTHINAMSSSNDKCYCGQLSANKSAPVTAWDDFGSLDPNGGPPKEGTNAKGKKSWSVKSRYGYETLEDKYKFSHYDDIGKYIEEYRDMFSVSNRGAHKKMWKPNGVPYNLLRMAPPPAPSLTRYVRICTQNSNSKYFYDMQFTL